MTIDPTPSLRPRRPARRAIRRLTLAAVATITITACSSDAADEPRPPSTQRADRIDHPAATTHARREATHVTSEPGTATGSRSVTFRSRSPCRTAGRTATGA